MGALTRAMAVRWEERREYIRKYYRKMKGLSHLSEERTNQGFTIDKRDQDDSFN